LATAQRHAGAALTTGPSDAAAPSPRETLAKHPELFDLDQAAFVMDPGGDPVALSFTAPPNLALPLAEVTAADPAARTLTTPLFGLVGPSGTLPRTYTAAAGIEARRRNRALVGFLDVLARRFAGMWVRAGAKYRPARDPALAEKILDAAIGIGTPGLERRMPVPDTTLRYFAGHLAARTRSANRLEAVLSEETGAPVRIVEFSGGWLSIPRDERTRLCAAHCRLGDDAVAGAQTWDAQARFVIAVGPVDAATFRRLLPGGPLFARICALARFVAGPEQDFFVNPALQAPDVPVARLGTDGAQLGFTSWLAPTRPRRRPADDARLRPSAGSAGDAATR
jgi:type VI secretion system protein ImpH